MAAASTDLTPVFQAAGAEWNVDPNLLQAVAGQESGGTANPDQAQSTAGAQGRMQIMPATGWQMGMTDPSDPVQSIYAGAKYLSQQLDKYGSPELALAAYNAGPGRVDDYLSGKAGLPVETVNYVPSIARRYQALAGGQQQSSQAQAAPQSGPSLDDAATAGLNAAMARLQGGGGGQSAPAPVTSPSSPVPAPPAASGPASSIAAMSPSDFFAATAGTSPASSATSAVPSSAPAAATSPAAAPQASVAGKIASMSPTDFFAATAGVKPPSSANANAAPEYSSIPTINDLAGGAVHGFHSVVDALNRGAAYVDSKVPFLAKLDAAAGENPAADVAAQPAAEAAYQQKYGNSTAASVGNFVGQTAAAAPILASGGALIGGLGAALAEGVGGAATGVGRGIQAGVDMLTGTASAPGAGTAGNMLARGASLAVNGGAQGAGFNALTGGDPVKGAEAGMVLGPVPAAGGLLLKGMKQVGSAGAGVFNKLTGSTAALDADINAAIARSRGAGDNALNPGGASVTPGQATPTVPTATAPASQNALAAGVTSPPAPSPITTAPTASTAAAPAFVGAAPAGWRPMQPGEPMSVGQQVATDAQGQQWTSAPASAPAAAPNPTVAPAPVTPVTATALPPPTGAASRPVGSAASPEPAPAASAVDGSSRRANVPSAAPPHGPARASVSRRCSHVWSRPGGQRDDPGAGRGISGNGLCRSP